ncbi:MAG: recombinase family protein [Alphaproteobacteria bacterium]|nr:recombinase family protein [Alphaproteobacteria bacterium]
MKSKPAIASRATNKQVGIWIRVSTEDQAQGDSPAHHEARARLYAQAKGWDVREVYNLAGVSGKSVAEHPEAKRMLADITSGRISGLIFSKLARLARNTRELLDFSDMFQAHGADLVSLEESIDTSSPAGRMFYTMIAALSQWEREEIAARVRASVPIRAKLGKPLSGQLPYGYMRKDGKVVPNPDEAPVRKLMYELFAETRRKKAVARLLNERGYKSPGGKAWTYTTVNRLLRDPTAKGQYRQNYTTTGAKPGSIEYKPESEWVVHEVEPIVSVELWESCNAILEGQRTSRKAPGRSALHLFSGLTYCADCDQKMYVPSRQPYAYRCWKCNVRVPADDLETIYHAQLKGFLFSDQDIAAQMDALDGVISAKEDEVRHLERERGAVKREMDKAYQLYLADEISASGFGERNRPLEARLAKIDEELPAAQAAIDVLRINRLSRDHILAEARSLHTRWPELPRDQKRQIVETITDRITIGREDIDILLHYVPTVAVGTNGPDGQAVQPGKPRESASGANALNKATQELGLVRGKLGGTRTISKGGAA